MTRRPNVNKNVVKQSKFSLAKKVKAHTEENLTVIQRVVVYFQDPNDEEILNWIHENHENIQTHFHEVIQYIKQHLFATGHCNSSNQHFANQIALQIATSIFEDEKVTVLREVPSIKDDTFFTFTGFETEDELLQCQSRFLKSAVHTVWRRTNRLQESFTFLSHDEMLYITARACDIEAEHWHSDFWLKWKGTLSRDFTEVDNILRRAPFQDLLSNINQVVMNPSEDTLMPSYDKDMVHQWFAPGQFATNHGKTDDHDENTGAGVSMNSFMPQYINEEETEYFNALGLN